MRVDGNQGISTTNLGSSPNYEPNSAMQNKNTFSFNKDARYEPYRVRGLVARDKPNHPNCDFAQGGILCRNVMCDTQRKNTICTIGNHMKPVCREIQERAIKNFYKADPEVGEGIARHLGFPAVKSRL